MSLSRCSSWPELNLHYTEINIMYGMRRKLYNVGVTCKFVRPYKSYKLQA